MDIEEFTSNEIVSRIQNVDVVLDGHTHLVYNTTSKDKNGKDIYFTQTGTKLANIGQLIIKPDGKIETSNINEVPEPSDKTMAKQVIRGKVNRWVNSDMNTFIDELWEQYKDELNIIIGTLDYDLIIRPEGSKDFRSVYCRKRECTLGNLIADAFRNVVKSDLAFINGGGIRTDLLKGEITREDIINIMPFFNNLYVKEVDGQTLLDALEFIVSKYPNAFGGFLQVSGITFDVNTSLNSTVITDSDGMFTEVSGKRRVSNVKVNGEDLVPTKKYNLSITDFTGEGEDGYSMLTHWNVVNESV